MIPTKFFPSTDVPDSIKETKEFGLQIGNAIQYEWFARRGTSCKYYDKYLEFNNLRLYARAEQPIGKYKNMLATDGDMSHLNLDWSQIPILPKFIDIIVNGMQDRKMSVRAEAQDILSAENRSLFQEKIEADMASKDFLIQVKEELGADAFNVDPDKLPEDSEELSLYMNMEYKPSIEIAEEISIDTVLKDNQYQDIKARIDYDITVLGVGWVKHEFLKGDGIRISYVDPEYMIHSYTEDPNFKDCFYYGEVKQVHINEVYKINPNISDEQIALIKSKSNEWYDFYPVLRQNDIFSKDVVTLLYFNYKTTKEFVYKKKILSNGAERIIKKDSSFNPPPSEDFERVAVKKDVWYEGIMVAGTDIMLKWEVCKNMVRPKSTQQFAMPNYIGSAPRMLKGRIDSLCKKMIPFADQIQLTHLKLQQVKSRVVPDGVFIDADGINEVDLGTGAAYNPEDALRLYFQTGSVIGRSYTQDGEFNNARIPIQELATSGASSKMAALINDYNFNLNMIRDVTGINTAVDASSPDPKALVGLQKLAAMNSNVATRHILKSSESILERLSFCISNRIADILEYSDMAEEFAMKIGKFNTAILNDIKDLYLYNFGIYIEIAPDEEEKARLEENIQVALRAGQIDLDDVIDIRNVNNIKLANELLKVKRRKKTKLLEEREDMKMQMQAQINNQSAQVAAQAKMSVIEADKNAKIEVKQAESQFEMDKMNAEAQLKKQLMADEFNYNMQLKGIEVDKLDKLNKDKEDRKDERVLKTATAQSKMIEQRNKDLPPIDFESSEDTLDGFGLDDFNVT